MAQIAKRLDALEQCATGRGTRLIFVGWNVTREGRVLTTLVDGVRFTQEPSESEDEFMARAGAAVRRNRSHHGLVWVDAVDEAL